jgi:signal transduction histidine kinase
MRRPAFLGLRSRVVLSLLATSAVTVGVVAVTLLSPLERHLRGDELESLHQAALVVRPLLSHVPENALRPGSAKLDHAVKTAAGRVDAQIVMVAMSGGLLAATVTRPGDRATQAARAAREHRTVHSVRETSVATEATYAVAATVGEQHVGISVTRQLDEAVSAAQTVRHAMLLAAAAGMAAALVLGLALSRRLIRRLRSLRDTALRVARLGLVVEMVPDARRDEIGDLQRAFATMQSRLREQEDARRTFVSTASHELRTPLASLRLMLDLAHEELECDPPDHREARREVERAAGQAERLSALADKLLDLSHIDAGVPAELRLLDVATIAGAVVREFGARADATGQQLRLDAAGAAWAVADGGHVAQIVRIVLDNALRFAPAGEPIDVTVTAAAEAVGIRVCDRGPGIPPDERETIFQRFERGTATGGEGGFGLGLAIGRELAARMHGELVIVDGEDGGGGACFELRLVPGPAGD